MGDGEGEATGSAVVESLVEETVWKGVGEGWIDVSSALSRAHAESSSPKVKINSLSVTFMSRPETLSN